MPRVLTAGVTPAPTSKGRGFVSSGDPRHADFEAQLRERLEQWTPEADVWSVLSQLWLIGQERRELLARMERLDAQLDDPRMADHPRRPDALARYRTWRYQVRLLEEKGERLRPVFARAWNALPARTRAEMQRQPGWSQAIDAKTLANAMWESAKRGGLWPGGEKAFAVVWLVMLTMLMLGGAV